MKYDKSAYYYYVSGIMGMTHTGSFTRDKSRWLMFSGLDADRFTANGIKPYGASRVGMFVIVG